ncbi:MAG: M20/M25/M40 family metallo-hydrolase [Bacteroidales bacterium]|nr:M20/M25/M40 family metallo-hydrolase [Bacteroidales bacterium]
MNWELFHTLLSIDSTSGKERAVAEWLLEHLDAPSKQAMEVGDGTLNLLFSWGSPKVVFCTHMDTVPPYIKPTVKKDVIEGRGACDAKGQIFAMYTACKELEAKGCTDFGLLLLSGEETGSWGAKAFAKTDFRAPFLIVGEPTENKMVSASKGTKSYDLTFNGEAFHSGYPQYGVSAVDLFNEFYNKLKAVDWGVDPVLGETTWNIGLLHSDNPQNILSPKLTCRLYFRTTFVSDQKVQDWMAGQPGVSARGGDTPARYVTLPGFASAPVAFGSDAPHLTGFGHKIICGPGSIRHAHRDNEQILVSELEEAVQLYLKMYHAL